MLNAVCQKESNLEKVLMLEFRSMNVKGLEPGRAYPCSVLSEQNTGCILCRVRLSAQKYWDCGRDLTGAPVTSTPHLSFPCLPPLLCQTAEPCDQSFALRPSRDLKAGHGATAKPFSVLHGTQL